MKLYSLNKQRLSTISSESFGLEKEIQNLVENNLNELFNLELVKSEFPIKKYRLDTLCFDSENKSFVIIEYKRDKNFSVIDQGYSYLSVMLNNKSDFILEYNENCKDNLRRSDVDWTQSRVIFISPKFTELQKDSVNFKDVPFELWEIQKFENNIIGFNQHKSDSKESISTTVKVNSKNPVSTVSRQVKVYTEEDHINQPKVQDSVKQIYSDLKNRLLNLGDDIEVVPRKMYIGYKRKSNFVDINFLKDGLWVWINLKKGELDDPNGITRDVSEIGHYGNGDYDLSITEDSDLDYIMFLIKQSYKKQEK